MDRRVDLRSPRDDGWWRGRRGGAPPVHTRSFLPDHREVVKGSSAWIAASTCGLLAMTVGGEAAVGAPRQYTADRSSPDHREVVKGACAWIATSACGLLAMTVGGNAVAILPGAAR